MLKPFSPRQLVARVQTILRRATAGRSQEIAAFEYQDVLYDPQRRLFIRAGQDAITLTRLEARLLQYLMLNAGQVLPAEHIIDHVWGQRGANTEMLRQLIRRLRVKIEPKPDEPELIKNLPGVGYGFGT